MYDQYFQSCFLKKVHLTLILIRSIIWCKKKKYIYIFFITLIQSRKIDIWIKITCRNELMTLTFSSHHIFSRTRCSTLWSRKTYVIIFNRSCACFAHVSWFVESLLNRFFICLVRILAVGQEKRNYYAWLLDDDAKNYCWIKANVTL